MKNFYQREIIKRMAEIEFITGRLIGDTHKSLEKECFAAIDSKNSLKIKAAFLKINQQLSKLQ